MSGPLAHADGHAVARLLRFLKLEESAASWLGARIGSAAVQLAAEALRRSGVEPSLVATGGGSDANALVARDYDAVLLANGTEANHTPQESVTASSMEQMLSICEALVEGAAEASPAAGA